jgi:recombination protein RecT
MTTQAIQKTQQGPVDKMLLTIMEDISSRQAKLEDLLPPDMTAQRFKASVGLALAQQPSLMTCDRGSIVIAVMKAAKLGIDVAGGALGHGYLVPYGRECTFVPGYKGLVALAVLAGAVRDMSPVLVYENDAFEVDEGDRPRVRHKPFIPKKATDKRGAIIAAYTRVLLPSGEHVIKGLIYLDDIERVESGAPKGGPWGGKHRPEMIKKTSIKNAFKTIGVPSSEQAARLREALEADVEAEARGVDDEATHTVTPAVGVDGLRDTLKAKKAREATKAPPEDAKTEPALPLSHPDAEPPDEPGAQG